MRLLPSLIAVLSVLALTVPAAATTGEIERYEACANPQGLTVVTPAKRFFGEVETPIGQAFIGFTADAGSYIVDLEGLEKGKTVKTVLTLSADAVAIPDYDLIINGTGSDIVGTPESVEFTSVAHCATYTVETAVFFGTPLDTLFLDIVARP